MKRGRGYKFCFCILFAFIILVADTAFESAASDTKFSINPGEVVFLLDTSESMNKQDQERFSIDAVRQVVYSLPSNYKTGLVAYGTDIQAVVPLDEEADQWESALEQISFSGYTNAGEGLDQAVRLFSDKENIDRYIIMLTDGEIDMPDEKGIEDSFQLYGKISEAAKEKGIKIYIVGIGGDVNNEEKHIFESAELTDGSVYRTGESGTISEIIKRILFEQMKFPRSALGVTNGKSGSISAELPSAGAERVKIVLIGQDLENITADYFAENGEIISGRDFAVIDITRPAGDVVKIAFETSETTSVEAYMIVEYVAKLQTAVDYRSTKNEPEPIPSNIGKQEITYTHFADIAINLTDIGGKNSNIWNSSYYEGTEVLLNVNGNFVSESIHNGEIRYTMQIDGIEEAVIEIDTGGFSEQFRDLEPVMISFSPPADPEEKPDYRLMWIILGVLALALFIILLIRLMAKNSTIIYMEPSATGKESEKKTGLKTNSYTGKLNLYVVQTKSGEDIAPQTYRLFGRQSAKITLNQILSFCGIRFGKIGAEDIAFYPGYDKSLVVMDQSEKCTVMRGTEILKKGMGYPVYYNGKITITFEDGITEMELYYRNLKSGEYEYE